MKTRAALWAAFAATAAVRIGFGGIIPVLPLYAREHGMSTLMIATMTNAFMLSNALFQSVAGHLGDRFGRRPVMLAGTWLYTLAAALFLVDGGPWYYVALRAVEGLGSSAFGPTVRAYVADLVPEEERARAYGTLSSFETAGILFGPILGAAAQALGGDKAPFLVCAILGLVAGVPLMLFARGGAPGAVPEAQAVAAGGGRPARGGGINTGKLLRTPAFWAVALPSIGMAYLNGLYTVIWSLYMQRMGATQWQINMSYTLFAVPMVLLMVPFGALADKWGRTWLVAVGGVGSTLAVLSYGFFPYPNALIGMGVLDGVCAAMFTPASQAFMADVTPPAIRGRFMGLIGSVGTGATVLAGTAIGYMYERVDVMWLFVLGGAALLFACGSATVLMLRYPAAGLRRTLEQQAAK